MANDKPEGTAAAADQATVARPSQRLGGARADFVASLGRKIADIRGVLAAIQADPESSPARDELRRKLHAMGAGAKLLHFDRMSQAVQAAESLLVRAAEEGPVRAPDLERIAQTLDEMPALAWDEERPADVAVRADETEAAEPSSGPVFQPNAVSVLVVGPEELADAVADDGGAEGSIAFECERVTDPALALSAAHALAPDVVLLDGDAPGAADMVQELLDDPLTEAVPVVVALTPGRGDSSTRFMALGVAKILARPIHGEAVRDACQEAADQRDGKTVRMTLGEPTLEQLGERLAEEVRRALVDSVDPRSRGTKVVLGDGTEIWGALWGAIARVREVVTTRTGGAVQFLGAGPEGAVALAPTLMRADGGSSADRTAGRNRAEALDVNLKGRRVIVADDDPGVTWFISDLLRTAGCDVHEALDGRTALRMAYELSPELVVSDILMPGLDGFALCRALKRDVALRDTPVILLSWKEDLLQRVRELGASAAAYLRKESDARAIVARVREVMRPRARIAARLAGSGEVRGRLDGLTVRTLLELVVAARPDGGVRVSVRDASFLYEVELWRGGIHRASRTSGDGTFLRGDRVIPAMLGVGAGRFIVSSTKPTTKGAVTTSLAEQFAKPISLARAALHATTGARMMNVAKVVLDDDDVSGYLLATPEPARELVRRLARGMSPREILLHGDVSPALVEDVLADLSTRGAIVAVYRADGSDALRGEAFDTKAILTEVDGKATSVPPVPRASTMPPPMMIGHSPEAPHAAVVAAITTGDDEGLRAKSTADSAEKTEPQKPRSFEGELPVTARSRRASIPPTAPAPNSSLVSNRPDISIPIAVEPTDDLRIKGSDADSAPLSLRARPSKAPAVVEEPKVFPRPLAFGLAVLVVVVAALAYRFWTSEHANTSETEPAPPAATVSPGVAYADVPAGVTVPHGQGLLSVTVADGTPIRIDGNASHLVRSGRAMQTPLPAGVHLISVGSGGTARSRILEVREGRATNVDLDAP